MLGCVYMIYDIQYMNALGGPWEDVETNNISESIFLRYSLLSRICGEHV